LWEIFPAEFSVTTNAEKLLKFPCPAEKLPDRMVKIISFPVINYRRKEHLEMP
jgi:hypothetical protein